MVFIQFDFALEFLVNSLNQVKILLLLTIYDKAMEETNKFYSLQRKSRNHFEIEEHFAINDENILDGGHYFS